MMRKVGPVLLSLLLLVGGLPTVGMQSIQNEPNAADGMYITGD